MSPHAAGYSGFVLLVASKFDAWLHSEQERGYDLDFFPMPPEGFAFKAARGRGRRRGQTGTRPRHGWAMRAIPVPVPGAAGRTLMTGCSVTTKV
jgi:hypothetical protein